jgi:hypothetical protein
MEIAVVQRISHDQHMRCTIDQQSLNLSIFLEEKDHLFGIELSLSRAAT